MYFALLILTSIDVEKSIYETFVNGLASLLSKIVYFDFLKTKIIETAVVAVNFPGSLLNFAFALGVTVGTHEIITEAKNTLRDIGNRCLKMILQSLGGFVFIFALSALFVSSHSVEAKIGRYLLGFVSVGFASVIIGACFGSVAHIIYLITEGLEHMKEVEEKHKPE